MTTAISLVSSGAGVTTLPELALSSLNLERVAIRPVVAPVAMRTLGTLTLKRRSASPASEITQSAIAGVCKEMLAEA
jgi:DNA-binding transcriptional LysR family regulator